MVVAIIFKEKIGVAVMLILLKERKFITIQN